MVFVVQFKKKYILKLQYLRLYVLLIGLHLSQRISLLENLAVITYVAKYLLFLMTFYVQVMTDAGVFIDDVVSAPESFLKAHDESVFAPVPEEAKMLELEKW